MFLRRLIKSEASVTGTKADGKQTNQGPPPGMQTMGASLQSKFARGVNYNMKIIIRGDRNVGKTCLHLRLQGKKFREEYLPTDEIQVASIQWSYKTSDDIIKVEIWDVVDKGRKKKKMEGLKFNATLPQLPETCLDAEFVDVYKGTHGVIMMFDITKQWTFDYVEKELSKMPPSVPVLVLANHRDMGHHRTVTEEQVQALVETMQHSREGPIKYAESSMRNGYGLKYIHKFFNLPFLHLQRATLVVQLEKNSEEICGTMQELELLEKTEDQNYDIFSDTMNTKRREQQEKLAQIAVEDAGIQQQQQQQQLPANQISKSNGGGVNNTMSKSFSFSTSLPPIKEALQIPGSLNLQQNSARKIIQPPSQNDPPHPSSSLGLISSKSAPSTPCQGQNEVESLVAGGFLGKFLSSARKSKKNGSEGNENGNPQSYAVQVTSKSSSSSSPPVKNVDEFQPDVDEIDDDFLNENSSEVVSNSNKNKTNSKGDGGFSSPQNLDSDDETSSNNPLVACYQDNLHSSDEEASNKRSLPATKTPNSNKGNKNVRKPNANITLSSDEEDEDASNGLGDTSKSEIRKDSNPKKDNNGMTARIDKFTSKDDSANKSPSPPPTHLTFNAADFEALEDKYIRKGTKETSSGADGFSTSTDDDVSKKKKKKHKSKENQESEKERKPEKLKESKHKDESTGDANETNNNKEDETKRKKKKHKKHDDDLEKFLGSSTTYEPL